MEKIGKCTLRPEAKHETPAVACKRSLGGGCGIEPPKRHRQGKAVFNQLLEVEKVPMQIVR